MGFQIREWRSQFQLHDTLMTDNNPFYDLTQECALIPLLKSTISRPD